MNDKHLQKMFKDDYNKISSTEAHKQKVLQAIEQTKVNNKLALFMEKELTISLKAVKLTAVTACTLCLLFVGALFIPGDVPEPQYQIIDMQIVSTKNTSVKGDLIS